MSAQQQAKFFHSGGPIKRCPNRSCLQHELGERGFYEKRGYFKTKWNGQPVARYRCRSCAKWFSSHTERESFGQHRPDLNQTVFSLYSSGMTQRRMALVLGVHRRTIARKFLFLAQLARQEHERRIAAGELGTTHVQFDEMESFEHTRLKPLAIALAVRARSGQIIDLKCAQMTYKGPLAAVARRKYGPRPDQTAMAIREVLSTIGRCSGPELTLTTDADPRYLNQVRETLPQAHHRSIKRCYEKTDRKNKNDHLFTLNYTAAKIRNDLSRMARKTWVTTKKTDRLQAHLDLYLAYNNGYQIAC